MHFKKAICTTLISTLLFPVVYNIEYVDAAEYSIDIVVDTVEIDINDIPEDRCVKVGISLYNNPGVNGVFFPLEKDSRLTFNELPPIESNDTALEWAYLSENIRNFSVYYGTVVDKLISGEGNFCYIKFSLPETVSVGDFFSVDILESYLYKSNENSSGIFHVLSFSDKDLNDHFSENFNITNGGIRIVGSEPLQTEPTQTDPPQTDPPQTDPPQTDPPQTNPSQTTSVTVELTTTTTVATIISESTTTENTTVLSTSTSATTTEETTTEATTKSTETSEVTESSNTEKKNNSLLIVLAVLASIGVLSGIIGFIIKKSKGHGGK